MDGGVLSATEQQTMVSAFLEIAVGETSDTARQFLEATSWKLEEAIQLFFIGNEGRAVEAPANLPPLQTDSLMSDQNLGGGDSEKHRGIKDARQNDGDEVRSPLPVKRDVLYDSPMFFRASRSGFAPNEARPVVPFRNFDEESKHPGIWGADQGATSKADTSRDNLASLYRPPFALMYHGPFEKAKEVAKAQNKWLLVNLQSTKEFSSHMLNRDTWANEAVSQMVTSYFIFWQVCDDTEEGSKISTYYKLDSVPVILVIDPVTGQKMRLWCGMVEPDKLLEDLLPFIDRSPKNHHFSLSHKRPRESSQVPSNKTQVVDGINADDQEMLVGRDALIESMKDTVEISSNDMENLNTTEDVLKKEKHSYPPLPEEPKGDRNLICRVGVRLPDGRRLQRNFLRVDPIQLLWSFCYAELNGADVRPFRLTHAIPGALKALDYDSKLTFADSGLSNSMISVTWE